MNRLVAPAHWGAIDFLSDLHLSAATPRTFAALAQHLASTQADAVLILGDLFEAWIGDDARTEGFEREAVELLAGAASRRWLGFMAGNRDFLVGDALLAACGMHRLPDPTLLQAFGMNAVLTHGDAWCLSDVAYQRFRAEVRSPAWQRDFLAQPLAQRRRLAREMRDASERSKRAQPRAQWSDVDPAVALDAMRREGAPHLVHGHTHLPADEALAPGFTRHVLSDWDFEAQPPRGEVLRLDARGFRRLPLA